MSSWGSLGILIHDLSDINQPKLLGRFQASSLLGAGGCRVTHLSPLNKPSGHRNQAKHPLLDVRSWGRVLKQAEQPTVGNSHTGKP